MAFPTTAVTSGTQAETLFFNRFKLAGAAMPTGGLSQTDTIAWALAELLNTLPSNIALNGLLVESATDTITANPGGGQTNATALTTEVNRITTVATAGDSVKLPPSVGVGPMSVYVINHGANAMQVFGAGTETINDVATATGVSQMANSTVLYTCATAGTWYSEGLQTGFFNGFQTLAAVNAITAFATGGQANAVLLSSLINRVAVCATAGDSVKLPVTTGLPTGTSLQLVVINDGAASCNVFPSTGDTINGLAANTAFALPAGQTVTFTSSVAGAWQTSPAVIPLPVQWKQNATAGATTAAVGDLTGAYECIVNLTSVGAANYTTRTAAQMIADGVLKVGQVYKVVIVNTNAGTTTLVGGTGVTITGTATIATNISRVYTVTVNSATTMTFQEAYSGAQ